MKNPICPLCGNEYVYKSYYVLGDKYTYPRCEDCKYNLECRVSFDAAKDVAKDFISGFPRIMRLAAGDKIRVCREHGNVPITTEIISVNVPYNLIDTRTGCYSYDEVTEWPWELDADDNDEPENNEHES